MYLDKLTKSKFSIGKHLRAQKNLRKRDPLAKVIDMPKQLTQYMQYLQSRGMQFKGLQYAIFYTKNGLPYPGLVAKQKILANTIMLRVPLQCLLTTKIAFFSQLQTVFQQNPLFYSKTFSTDWQDHILLTFLLYQHQKGKQSQWYYVINNLPKDIDYAIFWHQQQLQWMQDKWMQLGIEQQRKHFQQQCSQFTTICKKYPQLFNQQTYSLQNIKWIQSHLVTRCFGKYFQYTTMVPFAELFNHECVDVYYTMDYKPGNLHTQNQVFYQEKQLTKQQEQEMDSSQGSYEEDDFYQEDQYFQSSRVFDSTENKEQHKEKQVQKQQSHYQQTHQELLNIQTSAFPQHPNPSIDKDIKSIKSYILTFINFNDSVSLNYLIQIFSQLELISTTQVTDEQHYERLKQRLREIHSLNVKYVKLVKQYYTQTMKSKLYVYGIKQKKNKVINSNNNNKQSQKSIKQKQQDEVEQGKNYFNHPWPDDKFDDFVMLCSTKDQFEKGSQVYFCYGRLPNKLLLLRYGIALQHNKYNHLFIRINIKKQALQSQQKKRSFRFIIQNQVNMRKYKRFKLKRTKFCHQLLTFIRCNLWQYPKFVQSIFVIRQLQRQLDVLKSAKDILLNELSQYSDTLQRNRQKLTDKSINYHQYFCLVYKIENQEILHAQKQMITYAQKVIEQYLHNLGSNIKKGLQEILSQQQQRQNLTKQIMMQAYFKQFQILKKWV